MLQMLKDSESGGYIIPRYTRPLDSLSSDSVEAIVLRAIHTSDSWSGGAVTPKRVMHLDLPQSVDWLKLVNGRWLIVASSDNYVSKLSCWDMSLVSTGSVKPSAECFLPGRVNTVKLEVQSNGVVIALGISTS